MLKQPGVGIGQLQKLKGVGQLLEGPMWDKAGFNHNEGGNKCHF